MNEAVLPTTYWNSYRCTATLRILCQLVFTTALSNWMYITVDTRCPFPFLPTYGHCTNFIRDQCYNNTMASQATFHACKWPWYRFKKSERWHWIPILLICFCKKARYEGPHQFVATTRLTFLLACLQLAGHGPARSHHTPAGPHTC